MPESKVDSNGTSSMLRRLNIGGGSASSASSSTTVRGPPLTMEDLSNRDVITPNDVKRLNAITDDYLCRPESTEYKIDFTKFKIRDMDTGRTLFEIAKPDEDEHIDHEEEDSERDGDSISPRGAGGDAGAQQGGSGAGGGRFVRYHFSPQFLRLKQVGATIEFSIGDKALNKFRMVERHFFKDRLLKEFDFDFGFCMPNSNNSIEHIYEFPALDNATIQQMVESPWETKSDSFYFVDDRLIMHNKAEYCYNSRA
ncbi:protein unc-119-like [Convolutriloba macropyga]|uniref:protein unc-119-like n=1 Tax=Convolutriloba macropyga TaxID=536237 RepID=UPI003F520FF2